jgi:hypothetical protein
MIDLLNRIGFRQIAFGGEGGGGGGGGGMAASGRTDREPRNNITRGAELRTSLARTANTL